MSAPLAAPVRTHGSRLAAGLYLALSVAGLVGTWYFNLTFQGGSYLEAWFANSASSSAAIDVIVTAVAACLFYVREAQRLRRRWPLVLVPLTPLVALAFTLPLFLAVREWTGATPPAAT